MTPSHSGGKKTRTRLHPAGLRNFFRRRPTQRGQTTTEYILIVAYVSIISLQMLEFVSFINTKEYVIINCTLLVGNMQGQTAARQMAAVDNYLSDPDIWQHVDADKIASTVAEIHAQMHTSIYGY